MSDRRQEILNYHINNHPTHGLSIGQERIAIGAMDEYMKEVCLELLEYMAKGKYECFLIEDKTGNISHCFSTNGRDYLTKEQLFENFL